MNSELRSVRRAQDVSAGPAVMLLTVRLGLVAGVTVLAWLIVSAVAGGSPFPPSPMIASLSLLPVNIVSLLLAVRLLRRDGTTLRSLFGIRPGAWLRDTGWGLLWIAVLYLPFVAAVLGTMLLLHGARTFEAFETVFYNPDTPAIGSPGVALTLGILAVLTFAPLNAPTEEVVFRGYGQSRLAKRLPVWTAVAISSVAFGAQHAFFAPTADAMLVYVVAFTVWGIGSGIIVRRQRRLLPITIAHFLVNLMTSAPAVVFPILQLSGAITV